MTRTQQEKSKEMEYLYKLVEFSCTTARCIESHKKVVLVVVPEMKLVFVT